MFYKLNLFFILFLSVKLIESFPSDEQTINPIAIEDRLALIEKSLLEMRTLLGSNNNGWSTIVVDAISKQRFHQANEIIESKELTLDDWENIIADVYSPSVNKMESLINFGLSLKISTNKLIYYLTLRNFLENKKCRASDVSTTWFLVLEQEVKSELKKLIVSSFTEKWNTKSNQILKEIKWDVLAEIELNYLKKNDLLFIQNVMNQTLLEYYYQTNISSMIESVEKMPTQTELGKISRCYIYGALHYAINKIREPEQQYVFKLAYNIKKYLNSVDYKIGTEYFNKYLNHLMNSLPGCVKNIINVPHKTGVLIKNANYDEYLYAVTHGFPQPHNAWKTTPIDLNKSTYRPVFTWMPKTMDIQGKWILDFDNDRFFITSGFFSDRYLDTLHKSHAHAPTFSKQSDIIPVRILPSRNYPDSCYIQNYQTRRFLYAGPNDAAEDDKRRTIFTDGTHLTEEPQYLWHFYAFENITLNKNLK